MSTITTQLKALATSPPSFVAIAVVAVAMAFSAPSFITRLMRPMSTSTIGFTAISGSGSPADVPPANAETATIAAGCFWGTEYEYRKHFGKDLYGTSVGYIGGDVNSPSYRAVCTGKTGHAEAAQIHFDPSKVTYRQIIEFFYKMHDPTSLNSQGNDVGTQYRSGIFFHSPEQEKAAREVTELANKQWWNGKIVTEILPAGQWWSAEQYHQDYLNVNPGGYVCATHYIRPFPPLQ